MNTLLQDAMATDAVPRPRAEIGSARQDSTSILKIKESRKKRVLVVGSVGAGKSSLINTIAEKSVTSVVDGAQGGTQNVIAVAIKHNDVEYEFIDTPGLDGVSEPETALNGAVPKLYLFLASEKQNFSCVLFVWRKGRISNTFTQSTRMLKD